MEILGDLGTKTDDGGVFPGLMVMLAGKGEGLSRSGAECYEMLHVGDVA